MTRLIAPEYLKEFLFHEAALNGQPTRGLETVSLQRLLNDSEAENENAQILKLAETLRKQADRFPDYQAMFAFPSFYREILSFVRQMALYRLDENSLPCEDPFEKQLKEIVSEALKLDLKEKRTAEMLDVSIARALSDKDLKIVSTFESDYFNYLVLKRMAAAGMEVYHLKEETPASVSRRHALSARMEIEACAQYICQNGKPCNIVLCSPDQQMPVLAQVFERYGIPFSYTVMKKTAELGRCFRTLCEFACCPDAAHLCAAIEANAFPYSCSDSLLAFLKQVLDDIHAPHRSEAYKAAYAKSGSEKYDPEKQLKRDPVSLYTALEEQAERYFSLIQNDIDSLASAASPKEKLLAGYQIISRSPLLADSDEMAAGRSILSQLQDCIDLIRTDEDVLFFCRILENMTASGHCLVTDFCTVTDLRHPVSAKENTYVLGCCGRDYPGFAPFSGLFDETYVRRIKGFPALEDRQEAYISQLEWILRSCGSELVWSYTTNDYQGRELIGAYELDRYGESVRWPLVSGDVRRAYSHALSKETASALFVRKEDGQEYISSSVSAVENWFSCPYRYFLSSGLYLRPARMPDLSAESSGIWQHSVLENAVFDQEGNADKNYAENLTRERIDELISPYFEALLIASPNDEARIRLSKERMISSLMSAAEFLAGYEKSSKFLPDETEKTFRRWPVSEHIRLTGTIDRVNFDPANHLLGVLDYKSSGHSLSEAKVASGQQLQLLTYLAAAVELCEKEDEIQPAGTYYFSLSRQDITDAKEVREYSVNRTTWKMKENHLRTEDAEAAKELMIKTRSLKGWTFTDRTDAVDSEEKFVAGASKKYSYEKIRECLGVLYEYFYSQLTGDTEDGIPLIDAIPADGACKWCGCSDICRFHGEPYAREKVFTDRLSEERKKKS
ncbi:MAG: PD-(D/E)XK nuclease family protein [Erysipelotrichaceae bacterium]|nr:PD-(D/E)XK nuclease family protein [Erysipelotrichaceae bacterium]